MYKYFKFSELDIFDSVQIYKIVKQSFENYQLNFEQFLNKHNGYCGSSFGYLFIDNSGKIKAWRAYLPMHISQSGTVHLAGVDACVDIEYRGKGILQELTTLTTGLLNFSCVVYGYPNSLNKSYSRAGFVTLAYFEPKVTIPNFCHNTSSLEKLPLPTNDLISFKRTFLESITLCGTTLFEHPTRKYALIDHNNESHLLTCCLATLQKKLIINYQITTRPTSLQLVGKSYNCDLEMNSIIATEFCDFL